MDRTGPQTPTLTHVVAANVKRLRELWGWSQDRLARELRGSGLPWTAASVAALETNRRRVDFEEFVLLKAALHTSTEYLLHTSEPWVAILGAQIPGDDLLALFDDDDEEGGEPILLTPRLEAEEEELKERRESVRRAGLPLPTGSARGASPNRANEIWGIVTAGVHQEAERQLARALGLSVSDVAALSAKLWQRTLTDERERRLGEGGDSGPPRARRRGHITRELKREIAAAAASVGLSPRTESRTRRRERK